MAIDSKFSIWTNLDSQKLANWNQCQGCVSHNNPPELGIDGNKENSCWYPFQSEWKQEVAAQISY
jgi:hypothetical protein